MITFVYGADSFSAKEKIKELRVEFIKKNSTTHITTTDIIGSDFNLADFRNKVLSSGFFSENKMIVVKDLLLNKDIDKDGIIDILKKVGSDTTLIFWESQEPKKNCKLFKFLEKQKTIFKFNPLSNNELQSWIREHVKKYGCDIDNRALLYIIEVLGFDLWKIELELNKLCLNTDSDKKVTEVQAKKMLVKSAEENIFKFIDALSTKNKKLALKLLKDELDSGAHELLILGAISRQIGILIQTKQILLFNRIDKATLANDLDIHPFVAQKSLAQVNNFHINELKNIYRNLLAIDMSIKTSGTSARVLFDRMISKL